MLKKTLGLISDSATYGVSSVLAQLIGFLLIPFYTRYLTPTDYGILAMLSIIRAFFGPLANLGMTNAIFRRFNLCKDNDEQRLVLATGLISIAFMSTLLAISAIVAASTLAKLLVGSQSYSTLVILIVLSATLDTITEVPKVVLRANRQVRLAAGLNVLVLLLEILSTIWFVLVMRQGIFGIIIASLIGAIVATILRFTFTIRSFSLHFDYVIWKSMLSYGLPFLPHRLFSFGLVYFGQYMVGNLMGLDQAGLYNIAVKVTVPMTFVVNAVQQAWVPYKFQIHAQDKEPKAFFRSIVTYYMVAVFYLWVGVSVWGPEIIRLLTPHHFHSATLLVWAVALIPLVNGLYFMLGTGIELSNDTRSLPLISLAGLVTVILTTYLIVPYWGAVGAALATVSGWIVMTMGIYAQSQHRFYVKYDWTVLTELALIAALAVVMSSALQSATPLLLRLLGFVAISLSFPVIVFLILCRSSSEGDRLYAAQRLIKHQFFRFFQWQYQ